MHVHQRLNAIALEKDLRPATVLSYRRLLGYLDLLDLREDEVTPEMIHERLWALPNPNTRRSATIAVRSVLGIRVRIPKGLPRVYDLPDEATVRLALMQTPHEVRCLLMAYGALRLGEACAVNGTDLDGYRLRVARQVVEVWQPEGKTLVALGPVKAGVGTVVLPDWVAQRAIHLEGTEKPSVVRESLRRAGKKVGVNLNAAQLRTWCATTLMERGVPLAAVSKHLRHSDPAITMRHYYSGMVDATVLRAWQ